jgi:hypothetical protein
VTLAVAVGGTVIGGLLLTAIKSLTNLSTGDFALYVALPVVVLVLLGILVWAFRRHRAQQWEWWYWRVQMVHALTEVAEQVQRLKLASVIELAEAEGWTVEANDEGGLLFRSLEDDELVVSFEESDPLLVADRLSNLAPLLFPENAGDYLDPSGAHHLEERVGELSDALRRLRVRVRSGMEDALLEAEREGWDVEWDDEHDYVKFAHPSGGLFMFKYDYVDSDLIRERLRRGED